MISFTLCAFPAHIPSSDKHQKRVHQSFWIHTSHNSRLRTLSKDLNSRTWTESSRGILFIETNIDIRDKSQIHQRSRKGRQIADKYEASILPSLLDHLIGKHLKESFGASSISRACIAFDFRGEITSSCYRVSDCRFVDEKFGNQIRYQQGEDRPLLTSFDFPYPRLQQRPQRT